MVWNFLRRHARRDEPPSPPSPGKPPDYHDSLEQLNAAYEDIVVAILERARKKAAKHVSGDIITVRMSKEEQARCDFPVLLEELVFNRAEAYGLTSEEAYHYKFTFTVK